MKNKNLFLVLLGIVILSVSCKDIVEMDLSNQSVVIIAPANNTQTPSSTQLFKWEELEGALEYQIQIVKPDFANIQQFVLDSTISSTEYMYSLLPGTYQWRIKALNGSSQSNYTTYNLTIDSTLDLSGQLVALGLPVNNHYTNTAVTNFSWGSLSNATHYIFQILNSSGGAVYTQTIAGPATSASYTFTAEGDYQWQVMAQNATSVSSPASRNISFDQTAPTAPSLSTPAANDTSSNPVFLSWTSDANAIMDSVFVYADTNLTVLVKDTVTSNQFLNYTGIAGQDYFWRVKSRDAAGNWGPFSLRRKFIINP
jgi:hypothetical protein